MKLSNQLQLQTYQTTCKNLTVVNEYITYYQQYTRNTVENILKLSSLIVEMKEKEKSGELDKTDMNYFCFSVGLTRDGSTFRKFEQIGKHSETFWKYVDKLPDSYTVLYEITTLDSDKFEELMSNNQITSYVTLKDIKELGNKISSKPKSKDELSFNVKFDLKTIPEDEMKKFGTVIKYLYQISKKNIIEFNVPKDQIGKYGLGSSWDYENKCWIEGKNKKIIQPISEEEFLELEV